MRVCFARFEQCSHLLLSAQNSERVWSAAVFSFGIDLGAAIEQGGNDLGAASTPHCPVQGGVAALVCSVRISAGIEQKLHSVAVFTVEYVFQRIGAIGICSIAEQQLHASEVGMLGGVVKRFAIVRVGSGFQERESEIGVVVEPSGCVQTRERIVWEIVSNNRGVGIGAVTQKDSGCFDDLGRTAGSGIPITGEAHINERFPVLWTAFGIR